MIQDLNDNKKPVTLSPGVGGSPGDTTGTWTVGSNTPGLRGREKATESGQNE